ncbi:ATP-binding protein [Haliscomenobacter sp.]|uniref:ATP-binding protein n=1 Tax=Haliscomenobacter sp. TaxID=2717303 RepID=UPI003BA96199
MKYLLALLVLFCSLTTKAQKHDVLTIDSLPPQGILLDQGWKWHAGDNPEWKKTTFNDSKWKVINPSQSILQEKEMDTKRPLWLRIKLDAADKTVALTVKQSGATSIFLNGKLIKSYGKIDPTGAHTTAFSPIGEYLLLHLDSTQNTLAIRYYFQQGIRYKGAFDARYPLFEGKLFPPDALSNNLEPIKYFWEGFNMATGIVLFLIHFILFLFYPPTKANLWYSLSSLLSAIVAYCLLSEKIQGELYIKNQFILLALFISPLATFLLFLTVYLLLRQTQKILLWVLATLLFLATIYYFLSKNGEEVFFNFLATLSYIIMGMYMGYNAYRNNNKGGLYVMIGMLIFIACWAAFVFNLGSANNNQIIGDIFFHIANLSMPITISILLGINFGNTNRALIKNLEEINRLSTEKQQILASQNETLERQVEQRTAELKASQAQLIQSEKLASLGELTAGIAHEIQNPLNFVNNFAEVSAEMLDEMHEELEKGDTNEAIAIATGLKTNLEKINHHGQRASSIVKGMLEHSRASTGVKEPTDLNALADEFLRLAYHGLRAKDNNFNANMETHFDPDLPLVSVIPQDIGRVLLNLINNAFYAVQQRTVETLHATSLQNPPYQPTVTVSTQKTGDQIILKVHDNGNGIPESIRDKIFQPFFTTKPTGQGTGLGLSLAYDIVTKGHGGKLEVESTPNLGTTFVMTLEQV